MFISKLYRLGAHAMRSPAVRAASFSPATYAMAHNQNLLTQISIRVGNITTSKLSLPHACRTLIRRHASFCSTAALETAEEKQKRYRMGRPLDVTPKVSELRNIRDHKRRLLVAKYEWRRKLYKALCKDPELPSEIREQYRYKLSKLPRSSSTTRVRNRCVVTGRPRGGYRLFKMSRIIFRGLARKGELPGIKKESW